MGDVFKEQIVKRKPTGKDTLKRVGLVVAFIIIVLVAGNLVPGAVPVVLVAAGFAVWILNGFLSVEYEYIFTNGDLDIDVIYNRSRRKRIFTTNMKDIELMAHIEDNNKAGEFHGAQETKNFSSGVNGPDTYVFLTTHNNKRVKIIFEPNEMMLKAISQVVTRRKLFLRK